MAHTTNAVRQSSDAMKRRMRMQYVENLRDGRKLRPITIGGKKGKGGYRRNEKHRGLADN